MTKGALDLCNKLGNVMTCGVRDVKFSIGKNTVLPVEFTLNRLLLVGKDGDVLKLTSKCISGIEEYLIRLDSVIVIPDNCSYTSNRVTIDTRESDTSIIREIGIVTIDKLEISPVVNWNRNNSRITIEKIANYSTHSNFEKNRMEIDEKLKSIDTKHQNFSASYEMEKWAFSGSIGGLLAMIVGVKVLLMMKKKKAKVTVQTIDTVELHANKHDLNMADKKNSQNVIELSELKRDLKMANKRILELTQPTLEKKDEKVVTKKKEHIYVGIDEVVNDFGSPEENSQFS
jgi:hypothetical protein